MKLWPFGSKKSNAPVTCGELPVPKCLKRYFVPELGKCSMAEITGDIRCTCGAMAFKARRSEDVGLRFSLTCSSCGEDILLFDAKQHGWDALVCGIVPDDEANDETSEQCAKCGHEEFRATVWIEACEREEFVEDIPEGLTEDDWVNAYGWFGAHLTCVQCGHRVRDWADVETA
ncbi:MAG: hypothetical protein IJE07_07370 [Clostridia bacterium]|nr:hypothetical protein [Clostridia bacterium]